ncbi:hypothetical protein D3C76_1102270 [compost metagenome]
MLIVYQELQIIQIVTRAYYLVMEPVQWSLVKFQKGVDSYPSTWERKVQVVRYFNLKQVVRVTLHHQIL